MDALTGILPWLLMIVFFMVVPAMARRGRRLEVERVFSKLQRKRKSRIIAIVHRQGPMGLLGIPQLRYIDLNDAEDVLNAIRATPHDMPLEFVLHTPGGLVLPALQIARAIKAHPGPTTVFVPHYAMSGGTLIAMAADKIILNRHAVLGPIDPQIGGLPAASIASVVAQKDANAVSDHTLILADVAVKAQRQLENAARELLTGTVSDNAAVAVAEQMSSGRWTHDYPIEAGQAAEIGLPVSNDMPADIAEFMGLFPPSAAARNVTFVGLIANLFRGRAQPTPYASLSVPPPASERLPFTGYEPGPGARSFSYGPWDASDLMPQGRPSKRR